tara:strand:+ start:1357 stop:1788 length:432 start_codon:yes stop_codon:yes gene_type:complete
MRGVTREAMPYVCEADRDLPENEQTTFWLIQKNNKMQNESIRRYARASSEGRGGAREFDDRKLSAADIEEFQAVCTKVENYCWSEEYLKNHSNASVDENGFQAEITDPSGLADIVRDMPAGALSEVFDAVNNPVRLGNAGKKS